MAGKRFEGLPGSSKVNTKKTIPKALQSETAEKSKIKDNLESRQNKEIYCGAMI